MNTQEKNALLLRQAFYRFMVFIEVETNVAIKVLQLGPGYRQTFRAHLEALKKTVTSSIEALDSLEPTDA